MSRFWEDLHVLAPGEEPLMVNLPQLRMHLRVGDLSEADQKSAVARWLSTHAPIPALRRSIERAGWGDLLSPAA